MRRIKVILGIVAIVVASLAAFSGQAMADTLICSDAGGDLLSCDGNNDIEQSFQQDVTAGDASQTITLSSGL